MKNNLAENMRRFGTKNLQEQEQNPEDGVKKIDPNAGSLLERGGSGFLDYLESLGDVRRIGTSSDQFSRIEFIGPNGKTYGIQLNWIFQIMGEDDDPQWVDVYGRGKVDNEELLYMFDNRRKF